MKDPIVDPQRREGDPEPRDLTDTPLTALLVKLLDGMTLTEDEE